MITIDDTTRNQGGAPAGASTTALYLSTNATFDAGNVLLGTRPVPALVAGGLHVASTPVEIPASTPPGGYYLIAIADSDGVVAEALEANNLRSRAVQVGP